MTTLTDMTSAAVEPRSNPRALPRFNLVGLALIHFGALMALFVHGRPIDWAICGAMYLVRMFGITAGYHRYFSHRAFKATRGFQFFLAFIGVLATQKGPLWWAAKHRHHHRHSDEPTDIHSPLRDGFWHAHLGWIISSKHETFEPREVKDLWKFPELRFLEKWNVAIVLGYVVAAFALGGLRGLCIWYCASTFLVMHATFAINSLTHVFGRRVYATTDDSRNSFILAIATLGEGWHNNHHRYPGSARQGFVWWQIDMSYYGLKVCSWLGLVSDLHLPPARVIEEGRGAQPPTFAEVRASLEAKMAAQIAAVQAEAQALVGSTADAE